MRWQFVEGPMFMKDREKAFAGDEDFAAFQQKLGDNPFS
jgi:hypothetical protein